MNRKTGRTGTARIALGVAAVLLMMPLSARATTATPVANATATSTFMRLTTGQGTAAVASDDVRSRGGADPQAFASLIAGAAADKQVGASERTATAKGQREQQTLTQRTLALDDMLTMGLLAASISTEVATDVTSNVAIEMGSVDIMNGFATIGGGSSDSTTIAREKNAEVQRTIAISGLHTFALGDLLAALGASPLDLACAAVQDLGAQLDVDTATACAQLDAASTAVAQATTTLTSARAQVVTTKDAALASIATTTTAKQAAEATLATLQQTRATLLSQQSTLQSQTAGLDRTTLQAQRTTQAALCATLIGALKTACEATLATMDAQLALFTQLDSVNAQLDANQASITSTTATIDAAIATLQSLNAQVDDLVAAIDTIDAAGTAQTTCNAATTSLDTVASSVPSLSSSMTTVKNTVQTACDLLSGTLEALIDAPLISMEDTAIAIHAIAKVDNPSVVVSGSIGTLSVGGQPPVAIDLSIGSNALPAVEALVQSKLNDIAALVGLDLPMPQFEFMVTDTNKGKRADGTWFAEGSVTAMRIHMPSATLSLPDLSPLAIVGNVTTLLPRAAALRASSLRGLDGIGARASTTLSPAITLDLATFDAASTFAPVASIVKPPAGGGDDTFGSTPVLPVTGTPDRAMFIAGIFLLTAAVGVRRLFLRAQ